MIKLGTSGRAALAWLVRAGRSAVDGRNAHRVAGRLTWSALERRGLVEIATVPHTKIRVYRPTDDGLAYARDVLGMLDDVPEAPPTPPNGPRCAYCGGRRFDDETGDCRRCGGTT